MAPATLADRLMGRMPPHGAPFIGQDRPDGQGERHLGMVLAYEGSAYAGWQIQPQLPTVQGAVEETLSRLCAEPIRLHASGRTDAGVHAWGQVAAFTTSSKLPSKKMAAGLRALLPGDILLREMGPVAPGFHPRYDARAKTYDYFIWPGARHALFMTGRTWPLQEDLDRGAMQKALDGLLGEHDLAAFSTGGAEAKGGTVREILEASLEAEDSGLWRISLTASGFLRHVVRNLVGTLYQVARGRLSPGQVQEMLSAGFRLYAGPKAPAAGLYLRRVYYETFITSR